MRVAFFASLVLLSLTASPAYFHSCNDTTPPDLPLPPTPRDAGVCTIDTDCPSVSACADVRCLAGTCVTVSSSIDRDHDGDSAIPCGTDCDDDDRLVHVGATEQCNGRDDDCNGLIDEGAPSTVTNRVVAGLDGTASIVQLGDGLLIAVGNDARSVDGYGRIGPLVDVLGDRAVTQLESATSPDGRAIVAAIVGDGRTIAFAILSPGTPPIVAPTREIAATGPVLDLAVVAHRGSFGLAWSWQDAVGAYHLTVVADAAAIALPLGVDLEVTASSPSASLASDGASLAFPEAVSELGFLSAGGGHVTVALPGTAVLRHGLASGDGFVVALTFAAGTTSAYASRVNTTGILGASASGVFDASEGLLDSDATRLARVNDQYVAARGGVAELQLVLFDSAIARAPQPLTPLPRGTAAPISIAALPGLVAVLGATPTSSLSAGSDLALITDCTAP